MNTLMHRLRFAISVLRGEGLMEVMERQMGHIDRLQSEGKEKTAEIARLYGEAERNRVSVAHIVNLQGDVSRLEAEVCRLKQDNDYLRDRAEAAERSRTRRDFWRSQVVQEESCEE